MIKRLLSTVFMLSSVSCGTRVELCNIQDPVDAATLVHGIAYRSYGPNIPSNMGFPVESIINGDLSSVSVDVLKNLKNELVFEACEVLTTVSYLRGNSSDNTPEKQTDLQRLFWNRIHLLQVWHVKYLETLSTLSTMHPDKAEAAEPAMNKVRGCTR